MRTVPGSWHAAAVCAAVSLLLLAAPAAAQNCGNGRGSGNGNGCKNDEPELLVPSATPEISSLLLLGSGVSGVAGYAVLRLRASRRRALDR